MKERPRTEQSIIWDKTGSTLCSSCGNACGRCSWSQNGSPVEGWTAEPTEIWMGSRFTPSFAVTKCPLYKQDEPRHTKTIRTDRVATFSTRLIVSAAKDFASACKKIRENDKKGFRSLAWVQHKKSEAESFLLSPIVGDMLHVCGIDIPQSKIVDAIEEDPDGVLERIQAWYVDSNEIRKDETI